MKRKLVTVLIVILMIAGVGVLTYPTISNQWNTFRQSKLIASYDQVVRELEEEDFSDEWAKAREFNEKLGNNSIYADAFGVGSSDIEETDYWPILNVSNDGIMGYISIPKINIKLAIYHGTGDDVLETGVGHLPGSKLPIGGESTHSVLAAHRGLPSAKLFTDIDQLAPGDMFYIHVLDETLAYQVDQIYDMVDKDDAKTLEAAMQIVEGEDYVTLFTCTPYGVNSHRLLVRGTRVAYNGEEEATVSIPEAVVESVQDYYMFYLIIGACAVVILLLVMRRLMNKKTKEIPKE